MSKAHVKRGDEVVVITGSSKGKRGKVLEMFPSQDRVLVEGINLKTHHERRTDKSEGGLIQREAPFHVSNVMPVARFEARRSKKLSS